jgi:hypothetical protein
MKLTSSILLAATVAVAQAIRIEFFTNKACDSASQTYQPGNCNYCADPPGDWGAVRFSDIPSNYRVTIHNQNSCTPGSQVGQGYGPACWLQGGTKLRSAWVACPGQKLNGTESDVSPNEDTATISD